PLSRERRWINGIEFWFRQSRLFPRTEPSEFVETLFLERILSGVHCSGATRRNPQRTVVDAARCVLCRTGWDEAGADAASNWRRYSTQPAGLSSIAGRRRHWKVQAPSLYRCAGASPTVLC